MHSRNLKFFNIAEYKYLKRCNKFYFLYKNFLVIFNNLPIEIRKKLCYTIDAVKEERSNENLKLHRNHPTAILQKEIERKESPMEN